MVLYGGADLAGHDGVNKKETYKDINLVFYEKLLFHACCSDIHLN